MAHVPSAKEIYEAFKGKHRHGSARNAKLPRFTMATARYVEGMLLTVDSQGRDEEDVLEAVAKFLVSRGVDWFNESGRRGYAYVDHLRVQDRWEYTENVGYIIPAETYDTTIAWIYGDYRTGRDIWGVPSEKGFYITSFGDELQLWEEWREETLTDDEREERGPDYDSGCDLWTDDARHFYACNYRRDTRNATSVYTIRVPTPPEKWADRAQRCFEKQDEWKQTWLDADDEMRSASDPAVYEPAKARRDEAQRQIDALKEYHKQIVKKVDSYDDPWEGSSDAQDECDRPGFWFHAEKAFEENGCWGNLWFKRGGRYPEWKLLRMPKDFTYEYVSRSQPWRERYRALKEKAAHARTAATLAKVYGKGAVITYTQKQQKRIRATSMMRRRQVLRQMVTRRRVPVNGDLFYAGKDSSGGVLIYRLGGTPGLPALILTAREVQDGSGRDKLIKAKGRFLLWRARGNSILDWIEVSVTPSPRFDGLRRKR